MVFKFKAELEVEAIYELTYEENYMNYSQRDGQYIAKRTITKTFLDEEQARDFMLDLNPRDTKVISLIKKISLL